jgi:hypothetical protein
MKLNAVTLFFQQHKTNSARVVHGVHNGRSGNKYKQWEKQGSPIYGNTQYYFKFKTNTLYNSLLQWQS